MTTTMITTTTMTTKSGRLTTRATTPIPTAPPTRNQPSSLPGRRPRSPRHRRWPPETLRRPCPPRLTLPPALPTRRRSPRRWSPRPHHRPCPRRCPTATAPRQRPLSRPSRPRLRSCSRHRHLPRPRWSTPPSPPPCRPLCQSRLRRRLATRRPRPSRPRCRPRRPMVRRRLGSGHHRRRSVVDSEVQAEARVLRRLGRRPLLPLQHRLRLGRRRRLWLGPPPCRTLRAAERCWAASKGSPKANSRRRAPMTAAPRPPVA